MEREQWQDILLSPGNEDHIWELFHENSKLGQYHQAPADQEVLARMNELHESLPYEGYPVVDLPRSRTTLDINLGRAIINRVSALKMSPSPLTLEQLGTLLHYAYGVTRDNKGTKFPRAFRVVPSGGALYPLEVYFHSAHIVGLEAGLYHYNPSRNNLRLLQKGDANQRISEAMTQPNIPIALGASLIIFITAIFERSVFKYGERGYRFVLLEAGHVAQNINLVSHALGLGCLNIGGFFDRQIDDLLCLDGVTHSTVYLVVIGKNAEGEPLQTGSEKPEEGG